MCDKHCNKPSKAETFENKALKKFDQCKENVYDSVNDFYAWTDSANNTYISGEDGQTWYVRPNYTFELIDSAII